MIFWSTGYVTVLHTRWGHANYHFLPLLLLELKFLGHTGKKHALLSEEVAFLYSWDWLESPAGASRNRLPFLTALCTASHRANDRVTSSQLFPKQRWAQGKGEAGAASLLSKQLWPLFGSIPTVLSVCKCWRLPDEEKTSMEYCYSKLKESSIKMLVSLIRWTEVYF